MQRNLVIKKNDIPKEKYNNCASKLIFQGSACSTYRSSTIIQEVYIMVIYQDNLHDFYFSQINQRFQIK